jgi:hypothetical protein
VSPVNSQGQDSAAQSVAKLYNEGSANVESITTPTTASATVLVSLPSVASTTVLTLHGATPVITLPAAAAGYKKLVVLVQDATGSRIPTWAATGGTVKWVGAAAPTLQTAAAAVDEVEFTSYDGVNWVGYAKLHIA